MEWWFFKEAKQEDTHWIRKNMEGTLQFRVHLEENQLPLDLDESSYGDKEMSLWPSI